MIFNQVRAIVINRKDTDEKDLLLTLYSLEQGRMQVVVRGTHNPGSTLRRGTDFFSEGWFYCIPRRSLPLVNQWEPIETFDVLKRDLEKLCAGFFALKAVDCIGVDNDPDPDLYNLLKNSLWLVQNFTDYDIIRLVLLIGLAEAGGYSLNWKECQDCGSPIGADCFLAVKKGGFECGGCAGKNPGGGKLPVSLKAAGIGKNIIQVLEETGFISMDHPVRQKKALRYFETFCATLSGRENEVGMLSNAIRRFFQFHVSEDVTHWYLSL